jgi:hypothetical protein
MTKGDAVVDAAIEDIDDVRVANLRCRAAPLG